MSDDTVAKIEIELAVLTERVGIQQKLVKLLLALEVLSYVVDVEKFLSAASKIAG